MSQSLASTFQSLYYFSCNWLFYCLAKFVVTIEDIKPVIHFLYKVVVGTLFSKSGIFKYDKKFVAAATEALKV